MPRCDNCERWLSRGYVRVFADRGGGVYCRTCRDRYARTKDQPLSLPPSAYSDK